MTQNSVPLHFVRLQYVAYHSQLVSQSVNQEEGEVSEPVRTMKQTSLQSLWTMGHCYEIFGITPNSVFSHFVTFKT